MAVSPFNTRNHAMESKASCIVYTNAPFVNANVIERIVIIHILFLSSI